MRRRPGVSQPAAQLTDPSRGNQLPQAPQMRLSQQRPSIDNPSVLEQPGPRPVARVVGQQPHRTRYCRAKIAPTVAVTVDLPGCTGGGAAQTLAPAFTPRVPELLCGAETHLLTGAAVAEVSLTGTTAPPSVIVIAGPSVAPAAVASIPAFAFAFSRASTRAAS